MSLMCRKNPSSAFGRLPKHVRGPSEANTFRLFLTSTFRLRSPSQGGLLSWGLEQKLHLVPAGDVPTKPREERLPALSGGFPLP